MGHGVDSVEFGADGAAQGAGGGGSPVETGQFCSGASSKVSRAICPMNDLCFIIHKMHIKVNTPQYANEG